MLDFALRRGDYRIGGYKMKVKIIDFPFIRLSNKLKKKANSGKICIHSLNTLKGINRKFIK